MCSDERASLLQIQITQQNENQSKDCGSARRMELKAWSWGLVFSAGVVPQQFSTHRLTPHLQDITDKSTLSCSVLRVFQKAGILELGKMIFTCFASMCPTNPLRCAYSWAFCCVPRFLTGCVEGLCWENDEIREKCRGVIKEHIWTFCERQKGLRTNTVINIE